jgi:hypothetical protein
MKNLIIFVLGVFSALLVGFYVGCGAVTAAFDGYEIIRKKDKIFS